MLRKIRVLVVEDSLVFRELLVQNLNKDEGIEVVAAARDPFRSEGHDPQISAGCHDPGY